MGQPDGRAHYSRLVRRVRLAGLAISIGVVLCTNGCAAPDKSPRDTPPALYYAKDGSVYVSDPAGSPGRKLTDGPADTEPAPSPDGNRIAYVHKVNRDDAGGELWVLDLPSGKARRLVDPATLVPAFAGDRPQVDTPRWSPIGDRIAFLKTGTAPGGFLLTAKADTGAVLAPAKPLYAQSSFSWAPDGSRIAWTTGRADVSPVDVNVLTVGGGSTPVATATSSTPVATGTNASSVSYSADGRTILFTNIDANGSLFTAIPFALRDGGVYTVDPPGRPTPLFTGKGSYADLQVLPGGSIGFTEWINAQRAKLIHVLTADRDSRGLGQTPSDAPSPVWAGDELAFVGTGADRPLMVALNGKDARRVDTGVDAFAWGPQTGG